MFTSRNKTDPKKLAVGAAVAAAVGYVVGILTAPKSGKATRRELKQNAKKGIDEAEKEVQKLHAELDGLVADMAKKRDELGDKTSSELNELIEKAKLAKTKASEMLKAIKTGDAEDAELQKAVAEANKAIDHVRKYLKK
jgi:gas vesicle protein